MFTLRIYIITRQFKQGKEEKIIKVSRLTLYSLSNKFTYFKGEFGTRVLAYGFLFNFKGNGDMSVVNLVENEIRQPWFNQSLRAYKPDIITLIGHIGIRFDEFHHIIKAIRAIHPTTPIAVLGGHT